MENTVLINGLSCVIAPEELKYSLLKYLREVKGLTGVKCGCNAGHCGSCNILLDGEVKRACLLKLEKILGKSVTTVEGLEQNGRLHPVQESFLTCGVMQCGYCTPAQIITAVGLLNKTLSPTRQDIDKAFKGVYCRCGSYPRVIAAIQRAAAVMRGEICREQNGHSSQAGPSPDKGHSFQADPSPKDDYSSCPEPSPKAVGNSYPMRDAEAKVRGRLKFTDDYYFEHMLYGKVVFSEYPSALLLDVNPAGAENAPGVKLVLTHKNTPEFFYGPLVQDAPLLAKDRIRSRAEPVAAVFAESQEQAEAAAELVKVYCKPLEPVFTPQRALAPEAPRITDKGNVTFESLLDKGDTAQAFKEAEVVVEGEYYSQRIEHAYIETESAVTVPHDDGTYTSYSISQGAFGARDNIARALAIEPEKVNMVQVQIGGSFGGKGDNLVRVLSALAAQKTGRPAKLTLSRQDSLRYHPKRHPFSMHYKAAAKGDGRLTAMDIRVVADGGAYTSFSTRVLPQAICYSTGPYFIPNLKAYGVVAFTNNVPSGAMRGYGVPQVSFAAESVMDELAEKLELAPIELRRINGLRPGMEAASGQILAEGHAFLSTLDIIEKRVNEELLPLKKGDPAIGIGIASGWRHISGGLDPKEDSYADIELLPDGKIYLKIALAEMGNETQISMAQLAADELNVPYEQILIAPMETRLLPWGGSVMASRGTFLWGHAVIDAARKARESLLASAAGCWDLKPGDLFLKKGRFININNGKSPGDLRQLAKALAERKEVLAVHGYNALPKTYYPPADCNRSRNLPAKEYNTHHTNSYITAAVALRVDADGKKVKVLKVIAALDIGAVLNPEAARRQVEGGLIMSLGQALTEEFIVENGVNKTDTLAKYKIPDLEMTPDIQVHFVDSYDPAGPLGAKGVAEIPMLVMMPAVANAYHDATGKRIRRMPLLKNI